MDAFSVLTTSDKISLLTKEEIELLEILKLIAQNNNARNIFLALENYDHMPEKLDSRIKETIQKHFEKWRWIPFTYMGPAYDIDYFLQIWAGLIKQGIDPEKEIDTLKKRSEETRTVKQKMIKKLDISQTDKKLYDIAADIVFLKGYRKDVSFHGFYALDKIVTEIARRLNIAKNQAQLLAFWEAKEYLIENKEIDINEINKRMKFTIIDYDTKNDKYKILTGNEAKKFFENKEVEKVEVDVDIKELQGTTACSGKAQGTVKIVSYPEEMAKMEEGDVMVSHTTFPALVPAMKKAAAIITEDGGITCHAAIVARELKTPCVTGIKVATQVLKDGDLVEVDADKGIVRKLN
jgi:phosphoenolpyruvate synthase/pyruvate phosphate dikinase